jgi:predicted NAD/FAD-dependent oxidoreductase
MTVAGDWTACGLDVGCVEAAVMSGMLAAHAITGDTPALESIIGYDHP